MRARFEGGAADPPDGEPAGGVVAGVLGRGLRLPTQLFHEPGRFVEEVAAVAAGEERLTLSAAVRLGRAGGSAPGGLLELGAAAAAATLWAPLVCAALSLGGVSIAWGRAAGGMAAGGLALLVSCAAGDLALGIAVGIAVAVVGGVAGGLTGAVAGEVAVGWAIGLAAGAGLGVAYWVDPGLAAEAPAEVVAGVVGGVTGAIAWATHGLAVGVSIAVAVPAAAAVTAVRDQEARLARLLFAVWARVGGAAGDGTARWRPSGDHPAGSLEAEVEDPVAAAEEAAPLPGPEGLDRSAVPVASPLTAASVVLWPPAGGEKATATDPAGSLLEGGDGQQAEQLALALWEPAHASTPGEPGRSPMVWAADPGVSATPADHGAQGGVAGSG